MEMFDIYFETESQKLYIKIMFFNSTSNVVEKLNKNYVLVCPFELLSDKFTV